MSAKLEEKKSFSGETVGSGEGAAVDSAGMAAPAPDAAPFAAAVDDGGETGDGDAAEVGTASPLFGNQCSSIAANCSCSKGLLR